MFHLCELAPGRTSRVIRDEIGPKRKNGTRQRRPIHNNGSIQANDDDVSFVQGSFNPSGSEEADSDFDPEAGEGAPAAARKRKSSGSVRRRSAGKPGKRTRKPGKGKKGKVRILFQARRGKYYFTIVFSTNAFDLETRLLVHLLMKETWQAYAQVEEEEGVASLYVISRPR